MLLFFECGEIQWCQSFWRVSMTAHGMVPISVMSSSRESENRFYITVLLSFLNPLRYLSVTLPLPHNY